MRNVPENAAHLCISFNETELRIFQSLLTREVLYQFARSLEIMSWQAREEVMCHLQVQTSVDEANGLWTDDVYCCAELSRWERFDWPQIGG